MQRVALSLCLLMASSAAAVGEWRSLAAGLELRTLEASRPSLREDSQITVLRVDPNLWDLVFVGTSLTGESTGLTARQWSQTHDLSVAINAGMFATDYRTHVGYLRFRDHVNSSHINKYLSVAAFDPRRAGLPRFRIFDLDEPGTSLEAILRDYAAAVQNLRLIKRPRENRWSQQEKMWSEAALGEDAAGRILFLFSRSPFTMHDFNDELLRGDLDLVCAQHLEGGPEAQLYLRVGEVELELFGSFETSFRENLENAAPWPIPNVLGLRPRTPPK